MGYRQVVIKKSDKMKLKDNNLIIIQTVDKVKI